MIEEWRDVVGYEGRYEVSNLGGVRKPGLVLSPSLTTGGYLQVTFRRAGGSKQALLVHRMVGAAFIPNPNELPQIKPHRLREDQQRCGELREWVDNKENHRHAAQHDLHAYGSSNGNSKLNEADIPLIRSMLAKGLTRADIGRKFGIDYGVISRIAAGKIWRRA